jgi:hypothetical protein
MKQLKYILPIIIIILLSNNTIGQSENEARLSLSNVHSMNQIDSLKQMNPLWNINDKTTIPFGFTYDSLLFNSEIGDVFLTKQSNESTIFIHKIIQKDSIEVCTVSYIYLDGKKHSMTQISALRSKIIEEYTNGTPFLTLVKNYNEDGNPTGELDWFYKGLLVEEFDSVVRKKSAGEIFTVDVKNNKWYYVVLKTENNKIVKSTRSIVIKLGDS